MGWDCCPGLLQYLSEEQLDYSGLNFQKCIPLLLPGKVCELRRPGPGLNGQGRYTWELSLFPQFLKLLRSLRKASQKPQGGNVKVDSLILLKSMPKFLLTSPAPARVCTEDFDCSLLHTDTFNTAFYCSTLVFRKCVSADCKRLTD